MDHVSRAAQAIRFGQPFSFLRQKLQKQASQIDGCREELKDGTTGTFFGFEFAKSDRW
jgi:hypothetical protein